MACKQFYMTHHAYWRIWDTRLVHIRLWFGWICPLNFLCHVVLFLKISLLTTVDILALSLNCLIRSRYLWVKRKRTFWGCDNHRPIFGINKPRNNAGILFRRSLAVRDSESLFAEVIGACVIFLPDFQTIKKLCFCIETVHNLVDPLSCFCYNKVFVSLCWCHFFKSWFLCFKFVKGHAEKNSWKKAG